MAIERELRTFEAERARLLEQNEGQFVVIRGDTVHHLGPTLEDALAWGYKQLGLEQFMVRQVCPDEPVLHFARDLCRCPSFSTPARPIA